MGIVVDIVVDSVYAGSFKKKNFFFFFFGGGSRWYSSSNVVIKSFYNI
jgi:hypothetical protein